MSQFLKRMEQEQQASQGETPVNANMAEEDEYDEEEEKGDMMSDLPLNHPGGHPIDANVHAPVAHPMHNLSATGGSSGATPAASGGSSMPMPAGLIPVGNAINAGPRPAVPKPPSAFLGGAAGANALSALRNQYEPLEASEFWDSQDMINDTIPVYVAGTQGIVYVCLHGAGHSAMSFSVLAEKMKPNSTIVAFDWRGHGGHVREDEAVMDQQTLVNEATEVLNYVQVRFEGRTIILIGHSMGGAIATKIIKHVETEMDGSELKKAILGVVIIDVVEGTAMDALPFMEQIVKNRPVHFPDLQSVVKYGLMGGQVKDKRSARISMPAQVKEVTDQATGLKKYVWRTDLLATKQYWPQWFEGLTQTFLGLQTKKVLFLAGAERMDTELTVAHMQGKYEMYVIGDCGHVIQEDQPAKLVEKIMEFIDRRKIPVEYNQQMFIITAAGKKVFIGR